MNTQSLLKRGFSHPVYGEDALFHTTLENIWHIGAVMDGCSSAVESSFTAQLLSKLVSKGCKLLPQLEQTQANLSIKELSPVAIGEFILNQVFSGLQQLKKQLLLDKLELLSTLTLVVLNETTKEAYLNFCGDGYYSVNGFSFDVDQDNTPDFPGYHLDKSFEEWLKNHTYSSQLKNVNSICIATDGIAKLLSADGKRIPKVNSAEILLSPDESLRLNERYDKLIEKHGLIPYDDIAILAYNN